jgi:enoyl-CoA hydratase
VSARAPGPAPLSCSGLIERLARPADDEAWSPLTGTGVLVVDLSARPAHRDAAPSELAVAAARERLLTLPCPTLGFAECGASHLGRDLAPALDVVVDAETELDAVLATVRERPLASLALVQLLRQGEHLDVHHALVSESLAYSTLQAGPEYAAWLEAREARDAPPECRGDAVRVERRGARLVISFDRPARHNAYSVAVRDALVEALAVVVAEPDIREVVLRGEGPSFCSGGDLDEFGQSLDPATAHAVRSTRHPARLLAACGDRLRAQVHGACIGAGVELAAFAARVVARPDAFFQLPELGMGLVPGAGGTASLPRRIGRQRTARLALSGTPIDAETALRWSLVDEISGPSVGGAEEARS